MNPVAAKEADTLEKVQRHVLCRHYSYCLDYALFKEWKGFSCRECSEFSLPDWSALEWYEDALSCGSLIGTIEGRSFFPALTYSNESRRLTSADVCSVRPAMLLPPSEVSRLLRISLDQVLDLCEAGRLECVRIGKLIRIKSASALDLADSRS